MTYWTGIRTHRAIAEVCGRIIALHAFGCHLRIEWLPRMMRRGLVNPWGRGIVIVLGPVLVALGRGPTLPERSKRR